MIEWCSHASSHMFLSSFIKRPLCCLTQCHVCPTMHLFAKVILGSLPFHWALAILCNNAAHFVLLVHYIVAPINKLDSKFWNGLGILDLTIMVLGTANIGTHKNGSFCMGPPVFIHSHTLDWMGLVPHPRLGTVVIAKSVPLPSYGIALYMCMAWMGLDVWDQPQTSK
jgi:hypothetical protein